MDPATQAALITGGASLLGGIFGKKSEKKAQQANEALQREFAQNSIRWKVADAKAAGLHPLAALGAQTYNASPVAVANNSMGNALANMGQDVSRAIQSTRTAQERELSNLQLTSAKLDLEGKHIENQIRASQLARMNATGPAMAGSSHMIPGQGNTPRIVESPLDRVISAQNSPSQEPGPVTEVGYLQTPNGMFPVKSKDATERLEDDLIGNLIWNVRNRLLPTLGLNYNTPHGQEGYLYNPLTQQYQRSDPRIEKYTPYGMFKRAKRWYNKR